MAMPRSAAATAFIGLPPIRQLAGGDLLQPGDHAQQGGLAAAGRADEDHQLAILDGQRDVADGFDLAEGFGDVLEFDRCQFFNPSSLST